MKHCCKIMSDYASRKNSLLEYSPETKSYDFWLYHDESGTRQIIYYCPWCGKKLPERLGALWAELIEKQLGIADIFDIEWGDIPDEFKTDEWWKKRGL